MSTAEPGPGSEGSPDQTAVRNGARVGLGLYGALAVLGLATAVYDGALAIYGIAIGNAVVTLVTLLAGLVMVAIRSTRNFAAGLLIAVAIGVFVDAGVCFAVGSVG